MASTHLFIIYFRPFRWSTHVLTNHTHECGGDVTTGLVVVCCDSVVTLVYHYTSF